jgi:hypothetical protein
MIFNVISYIYGEKSDKNLPVGNLGEMTVFFKVYKMNFV